MITFDQRLAPASVGSLEGTLLDREHRIHDVRVDGNLLLFSVSGRIDADTRLSLPLGGITDDPSVRYPMPSKGKGVVNAVPAGETILLTVLPDQDAAGRR